MTKARAFNAKQVVLPSSKMSSYGEFDQMSNADIVIIGAGITGLAAAHAARRAGRSALILESSDRVGGRVRTVTHKGDTAEAGGQGIHTNYDEMLGLLREYGLAGDLFANVERTQYISKRGKPKTSRIKEDLSLMVGARGIADLIKFRHRYVSHPREHPQFEVCRDIPEYDNVSGADEFANYGEGFRDFVLRPLAQGMANTTPEHTNLYYLVNGLRLAMTTEISSLVGGNERLLEAMAAKSDVRLGTKVASLEMAGDRVDGVRLENGEAIKAKHVIVTTPARIAGSLLPESFGAVRDYLSDFPYVGLPLVFFFLDRRLKTPASRYFCQRRSKSRPFGGVKPGHRVTCRGEWREGVARGPLPPALV